jgi:hypothetical protein
MNIFALLSVAMGLSTVGFIVHSFFSYLKFRRTNALGGGKSKDYEELADAFQHYIRKTNKRIEHLEAINTQSDESLDLKANEDAFLDEHDEMENMRSAGLKNSLENR